MKIFALSGPTESGKDTVGRYLRTKGVSKLKIGDFLKVIYQRERSEKQFQDWNFDTEATRPTWLMDAFWNEVSCYLTAKAIEYASIDSLYGPTMARYLKEKLGKDCIILYIDLDYEARLQRQMISQNLSTLEEARAILEEKDAFKMEKGTLEVRSIATEYVDNSGTLDDLYRQIDDILQRHNVT